MSCKYCLPDANGHLEPIPKTHTGRNIFFIVLAYVVGVSHGAGLI